MAVPYTFGSATTSIPLSQLDSNFATTITLGNTAVQLGNTITNLTGVSNVASATSLSLGSNGNTTAMTINTSQNVGIGTTSPLQKLQVNGRIRVSTDGSDGGDIGVDSNGLSFSTIGSTQPIIFERNNYSSESMRIDSSGNVGIGTSSPSYKLSVAGSTVGEIAIQAINASSGNTGYRMANSLRSWAIFVNDNDSGALRFYDYTAAAERMRIDSSGNLLSANGVIQFTSGQYRSNVASSQLQFINNSAGVSLAVNGTSWGSLSDERDKEIIEPITNAVSKVSSLRSVIGRYKVDEADKRRAFLIAQDVQAVLPEAVTELEDEQKTLILQYTEVIPLLVASIKELKAINDTQAETINALTARIVALEAK
jgi:hypothetical protein